MPHTVADAQHRAPGEKINSVSWFDVHTSVSWERGELGCLLG